MFWGAVYLYGVSHLIILKRKQDLECYWNTILSGLLLWTTKTLGKRQFWVYQQDNAPIKDSGYSKHFISLHGVM